MGGNRTPVSSLEGPCSATELHPHGVRVVADAEQVKPVFRHRQGHDAKCRLTRLGGPPNAYRLAHRSKARHRDRLTALTGQSCNGEQANAKNDVEWRHRDRDHAGL